MEMVKKTGRKSKRPNRAEFEFRYYMIDTPAEELAKDYGVKVQTIYNWAREFKKEKE